MTPIDLAILGLLNERPSYGYELEATVQKRRLRQWAAIGFSSIYAALQSLRRRGLLRSRPASRGQGPRRRLFSLTERGRAALRREVMSRFVSAGSNPNGSDLALMFLGALRPLQRRRALHAYAGGLRREIRNLRRVYKSRRLNEYWESVQIVRRHTARLRAELDWARSAARDLSRRPR